MKASVFYTYLFSVAHLPYTGAGGSKYYAKKDYYNKLVPV
jgi:hypothetical protein